MIFVTVGTHKFDELIQEVDKISVEGLFEDNIVCQIGSGTYTPRNVEFFRYESEENIGYYISQADFLIGHGGTGTVISFIKSGKKFVVVANTKLAGGHQVEFLEALQQYHPIKWTSHVKRLSLLIQRARYSPSGHGGISMPCLLDDLVHFILCKE